MGIGKRAALVIGAVTATAALAAGGIAIASQAGGSTPPLTFYPNGNHPANSAANTTTSHERSHDDSRDDDHSHQTGEADQSTTLNAQREHDDNQSD